MSNKRKHIWNCRISKSYNLCIMNKTNKDIHVIHTFWKCAYIYIYIGFIFIPCFWLSFVRNYNALVLHATHMLCSSTLWNAFPLLSFFHSTFPSIVFKMHIKSILNNPIKSLELILPMLTKKISLWQGSIKNMYFLSFLVLNNLILLNTSYI